MRFEVNVEKKYFFVFALIVMIIVGIVGVIAWNADPSVGTPNVLGHSMGEIDWGQTIPSNVSATGFCIVRAGIKSCITNWVGDNTTSTTTGGSNWTQSGSNIYYNLGNVGIGTAIPQANLEIFDSITVYEKSGTFTCDSGYTAIAYKTSANTCYTSPCAPCTTEAHDWSPTGNTRESCQYKKGSDCTTNNSPPCYAIQSVRCQKLTTKKIFKVDEFGAFIYGNVGIGIAAPTAKLDVAGDVKVSGNFGIGTVTPTAKLDVAGNVKVNGNLYISGVGKGFILKDSVGTCRNVTLGSSNTLVVSSNFTCPSA